MGDLRVQDSNCCQWFFRLSPQDITSEITNRLPDTPRFHSEGTHVWPSTIHSALRERRSATLISHLGRHVVLPPGQYLRYMADYVRLIEMTQSRSSGEPLLKQLREGCVRPQITQSISSGTDRTACMRVSYDKSHVSCAPRKPTI